MLGEHDAEIRLYDQVAFGVEDDVERRQPGFAGPGLAQMLRQVDVERPHHALMRSRRSRIEHGVA